MKEDGLVNSLLKVAKELEKATYIKKFKKEYEEEMSDNASQNKMGVDENFQKNESKPVESNETLQMEVYEDKEYDIEEVKFWNFISKNKGVKPSIVRTMVYKCPESSYVYKKSTVTKPKKEKPKPVLTDKLVENEAPKSETKNPIEVKIEKTILKSPSLNPTIKQDQNGKKNEPTQVAANIKVNKPKIIKAAPSKNEQKQEQNENKLPTTNSNSTSQSLKLTSFKSTNDYKMEDLILIDEDDDIIGYNEDDDDLNINDEIENKVDFNEVDEDEEEIDKHEDEDENHDEETVNYEQEEEREEIDQNNSVSDDEELKSTDEIIKPKVVIEKVEEPPRKKKINVKQKKSQQVTKNETKNNQVAANNTQLEVTSIQTEEKSTTSTTAIIDSEIINKNSTESISSTCTSNLNPSSVASTDSNSSKTNKTTKTKEKNVKQIESKSKTSSNNNNRQENVRVTRSNSRLVSSNH